MMTGQDRIAADRMWRSPACRREFEQVTGLSPLAEDGGIGQETDARSGHAATYRERFVVWAASKIAVN